MSQNNLLTKRDIDSQIIREEDQELNDFYHEMQISLNPSLSNLDGCLEERYYSPTTTDNQQDNRSNYFTPYQVKNILACYQEESFNSQNSLGAIEDKNLTCENITKKCINSNLSFSSNHQRMNGETSSSGQLTQQDDNDILNDLSSTEKCDILDIEETCLLKQKLYYPKDNDDFLISCSTPYTNETDRIYTQKGNGDIKHNIINTQKFKDFYQKNVQEELPAHNDNINIFSQEPNIYPLKLQKEEQYSQEQYLQQNKEEILNQQIKETKVDQNQDIFQTNGQQIQQELYKMQNSPLKMSTIPCKCRKSMCLKLYCECFARGEICGPSCVCLECRNSIEYDDLRIAAIQQIEIKNPTAFLLHGICSSVQQNISQQSEVKQQIDALNEIRKGCNCRKSKCKKKYCECYIIGQKCTSLCQCINCANNIPHTENNQQFQENHKSKLQFNQDMSQMIQLKTQSNKSRETINNNNNKDQSLLPILSDINNYSIYESNKEKSQQIKSPEQFNMNPKQIYYQNNDDYFLDQHNILQHQHLKDSLSNQLNSKSPTKINNNKILSKQIKKNKKIAKKAMKKKNSFSQKIKQKQISL